MERQVFVQVRIYRIIINYPLYFDITLVTEHYARSNIFFTLKN